MLCGCAKVRIVRDGVRKVMYLNAKRKQLSSNESSLAGGHASLLALLRRHKICITLTEMITFDFPTVNTTHASGMSFISGETRDPGSCSPFMHYYTRKQY